MRYHQFASHLMKALARKSGRNAVLAVDGSSVGGPETERCTLATANSFPGGQRAH